MVGGRVRGGNDHPPRLLADLCGSELAGDISGFEPTAGGRRLARRLVAPPLFNGVIFLKVMTGSSRDVHSSVQM